MGRAVRERGGGGREGGWGEREGRRKVGREGGEGGERGREGWGIRGVQTDRQRYTTALYSRRLMRVECNNNHNQSRMVANNRDLIE